MIGAGRIDLISPLLIRLAGIHLRVGRTVDDDIRGYFTDLLHHFLLVCDI